MKFGKPAIENKKINFPSVEKIESIANKVPSKKIGTKVNPAKVQRILNKRGKV